MLASNRGFRGEQLLFAVAGAPNPEEISLENPEEIDLDGDDDVSDELDESPPDGPGPPPAPPSANADTAQKDSMFAQVEIHSFDPAAAAAAGAQNGEQEVSPALASAMQLNPKTQ